MNESIKHEIPNLINEIIERIESETNASTSTTLTSKTKTTKTTSKTEKRGRKKNSNKIVEIHNCTECDFVANKRLLLKKHFILKHSDKIVEPFKCEFCDKVFKDPGQLSNHRNVHIGLKPFKCNECELNFTTKGELIRHTRYKHTLERPHKCSFCDYSSVELSKLKRHIRVHTGERPYLCPYCDYASRDTFKLKRHLRIHTGEKPYECPVCKNAFSQSNSLKVHMQKNHTDIPTTMTNTSLAQPTDASISLSTSSTSSQHELELESIQEINTTEVFECKECAMKFLTSQLLTEHSIEHTGERPYSCEICGVKFTHKFALRSHKLSHDAGYSQKLKQKLKIINRTTAIANTNIPDEAKLGQQNFSYKKSIRNMMGINEKDNSAKETLRNIVEQQKIKNKIIEIESEKLKKANKIEEVIIDLNETVETVEAETISVAEVEKEIAVQEQKESEDEEDEDEQPPSPKIQFKVGQNKRKIQHAENSFVIMNDNKRAKTSENDSLVIENGSNDLNQTQESKSSLIECKFCSKKYVSESNLNRHVKQFHSEKKPETTPVNKVGRDEFVSHLNATVSAIPVPVIVEEIKNETDLNDSKLKKPKIKSIYDQLPENQKTDDTQPKNTFNTFTPIVKVKRSPTGKQATKQQKKSHLAVEDDVEEEVKELVKASPKIPTRKPSARKKKN